MIDYLETWSRHPFGQLHVSLAILALLTGPMLFIRRKGTASHRTLGYVYVVAMLAANATALTRYGLTGGFNLFHGAALASLATLLPAWAYAWKARAGGGGSMRAAHGVFMSWTYFGLIMAFFAELATRRFPYLLHGDGGWTRFSILMGFTMLLAGLATHRAIQRRIVDKERRGTPS